MESPDTQDLELVALPSALLTALGRVAAHYGQIEYVLTLTITRTTGLSWDDAFAEARKVFKQSAIRDKARMAFDAWADRTYAPVEAQARKTHFGSVLDQIEAQNAPRDDVIHCHWGVNTKGQLFGIRRGKVLARADGTPAGIADVEATADKLLGCLAELNTATRDDRPVKEPPIYTAPDGVYRIAVPTTAPGFFPGGAVTVLGVRKK